MEKKWGGKRRKYSFEIHEQNETTKQSSVVMKMMKDFYRNAKNRFFLFKSKTELNCKSSSKEEKQTLTLTFGHEQNSLKQTPKHYVFVCYKYRNYFWKRIIWITTTAATVDFLFFSFGTYIACHSPMPSPITTTTTNNICQWELWRERGREREIKRIQNPPNKQTNTKRIAFGNPREKFLPKKKQSVSNGFSEKWEKFACNYRLWMAILILILMMITWLKSDHYIATPVRFYSAFFPFIILIILIISGATRKNFWPTNPNNQFG